MTALHFLTNNLRRHPFGSLFIILLIAATTALSVAVNLQERALREGSAHAADKFDLIIGAPGSETQLVLSTVFLQASALSLLTPEQLKHIEQNPLVAWSSPVGFGDYYQGHPIVGVNQALLTLGNTRNLQQGRTFTHHNEAVVGARSGLAIGDHIVPMHGSIGDPNAHTHDSTTYTVVGILPEDGSVWDQAILVPIQSIWLVHDSKAHHDHQHDHQHDHSKPLREHNHEHQAPATWQDAIDDSAQAGAPAVIIKPKSIAGAYQLRSQYRGNGTQAVFPGEVLVRLYSTLGDAKKLLTIIAIVTQILVALAVAVIIAIYLNQQQRHIAALRAFGAPRGRIFILVWSGLLAMIGIAIVAGAALGYTIAQVASRLISEQNGFVLPVHFTISDLKLLLILFAIAAVTLLIPSLRHYRSAPAETLRGQ